MPQPPSLEHVAELGLRSVGDDLDAWGDIASACWQQGVNTGDARYCVLAQVFCAIQSAVDNGGAPADFGQVDQELKSLLPDVLAAHTAKEGTSIAALLASRILAS